MAAKSKKQWWETLFDDKYLKIYVDIVTPELTAKQTPLLIKRLQLKKGARILDLACGHGRLTIELAKRGYKAVGLDFSKHFINLAQKEAQAQNVKVSFIRDDMRNLASVNKFDAIINIFTSFGYFDSENDNVLMLRKISRALKRNGRFLIELNNTLRTLTRMGKEGKVNKKTGLLTTIRKNKLSNGIVVTTKDEFDSKSMRWSMSTHWKERGKMNGYKTDLRMFSLPELKHLMEENGLRVEKVWGGLDGSPFGLESPRMVLLARKS